jgi:hypothetical protein
LNKVDPAAYEKVIQAIGGEANLANLEEEPIREKANLALKDIYEGAGVEDVAIAPNAKEMISSHIDQFKGEGQEFTPQGFTDWLKVNNPELWKQQEKIKMNQGLAVGAAVPGYAKFTAPLSFLTNYAKPIGLGLGALGGGWLLKRYLDKKREKEEQEAGLGELQLA